MEGQITDSVTHQPIGRVLVTLDGPVRGQVSAGTDGAFRMTGLREATYRPVFDVRGYSRVPAGHNTVRIADGTESVRLDVELMPLAKLSGRVLDGDGRPVEGAIVMAAALHRGARADTSDAQGRFLLAGLESQTAILAASPIQSPVRIADDGQRYAVAATYFPNVTARQQAEPIALRAGAILAGYEIRLREMPVYIIRGVIYDDGGKPAPRVTVRLDAPDAVQSVPYSQKADDRGAFEFRDIGAGDWRLSAEAKAGAVSYRAGASVSVSRRDVDGVELRLARPFALEGFVDRDQARNARGERTLTAVQIIPAGRSNEMTAVAFHKQDGTLRIEDVYPGRYLIKPVGFVPGWYVDSVTLGGHDVLGRPVDLVDGSLPLRVTYKSDPARVRGRVEKCEGANVVLLPQDEVLRDGWFMRTISCDTEGRFEIASLRPGDYYAFAFDRMDIFALEEPAFVRALTARAARLHVERGEVATLQLTVTPWPE